VRHLALATISAAPRPTVLIGRPTEGDASVAIRVFDPIEASVAERHLATLLAFYRLGQKAPLSFFPKASRKFTEIMIAKGGAPEHAPDALESARRAFQDDRKAPADADDGYVRRLFEGIDPFADSPVPFDDDGSLGLPSFAELASAVFMPLLSSSRIVSE
jgi:exonuclease V gamma subunit